MYRWLPQPLALSRNTPKHTNEVTFSMIYRNIGSIMTKRDKISTIIQSSHSDIVMLTETWLSPFIKDSEVLSYLNNFTLHRQDCLSRRRGGVLIANRRTIRHFLISIASLLEALWVAYECSHGLTILSVCYRPPKSEPNFNIHFDDSLDSLHKVNPRAKFIICVDFHYLSRKWSTTFSFAAAHS